MIIDFIANILRYEKTLPQLRAVYQVIQSGALENVEVGQYKTDNPKVRYNVFTYDTEKDAADMYEIHEREIDVQILLEGQERMDIAWASPIDIVVPYDSSKDAAFVTGKLCTSYHAAPGKVAIFFPGEPHAPNLKDGTPNTVKKVVFKLLS
ncbi:MAG: YhcH/YjgK/YiaL family protein [Sphaerochaetaceae bacterium]|nr:YhcH/YjgK/YiaL family protein [Sphaerochaetaceae bacterium]